MSVLRTVEATMKDFWCDIDGKPISLDHIKQMNLYLSLGTIGEPGDITITYDMYKMLSEESARFSPVGKYIEFEILDDKSGQRKYSGVITGFRKVHNVKQDLVVMNFDREDYVKIRHVVWWKAWEKATIVDIFREFLETHNIPMNKYPDNHHKLRGTHWEKFAIPQNMPTLDYLLTELAKDNLVVFSNPETCGVTVASWDDINRLDILNQNNPDYVVDGILAKFDENKEQWKETTFVNGKQIDTRAPWKIMEWSNFNAPNIHQDAKHHNVFYSGLKKPLEFGFEDSELLKNDIYLEEVNELSGKELAASQIAPYPANPVLRNNADTPKVDTTGYDGITNQTIYPRYMYYRMRDSYAVNIKWIRSSMLVAGSAKAVVPMSTVMVTYFENAMNRNPKELAKGDDWQSGLYLIAKSQLIISGNNIMCKYDLMKPYS